MSPVQANRNKSSKTIHTVDDNDTTYDRLFQNKKSRDHNSKVHYRCGSGENILLKSTRVPSFEQQ